MGLLLIVGLITLIADAPYDSPSPWIINATLASPRSGDTVGDEFTMKGAITAHRDGHADPASDLLYDLQIWVATLLPNTDLDDLTSDEVYTRYTTVSNIQDSGSTVTADWSVQINGDELGYTESPAGTEIKLLWRLLSNSSKDTQHNLTLFYQ